MELPDSRHPDTVTMYCHWLEKCGDRTMPTRADIDPVEMPKRLLRGICLVDVVADERRYVYRLVGTGDVEVRGNDPTGKYVLEGFLDHPPKMRWVAMIRSSKREQLFSIRRHSLQQAAKWVTDETLFLPLSDDGRTVNKILVFSYSRDIRKYSEATGL